MKVYRLKPVLEKYRALECVSDRGISLLLKLPESRVIEVWQPPQVAWTRGWPAGKEIADYPIFTVPAFSQAALLALKGLLDQSGEVLPLRGLGGRYAAFHLLKRSNALDRDKSQISVNPVSGIITAIRHAVFVRAMIESYPIFGVVGAVPSCIYVQQEFADLVRSNKLKGFDLEECEFR
jgi:hypothetical protein